MKGQFGEIMYSSNEISIFRWNWELKLIRYFYTISWRASEIRHSGQNAAVEIECSAVFRRDSHQSKVDTCIITGSSLTRGLCLEKGPVLFHKRLLTKCMHSPLHWNWYSHTVGKGQSVSAFALNVWKKSRPFFIFYFFFSPSSLRRFKLTAAKGGIETKRGKKEEREKKERRFFPLPPFFQVEIWGILPSFLGTSD